MAFTKEQMKAYDARRNSDPTRRAYLKKVSQSPRAKQWAKEYYVKNIDKIKTYRNSEAYKDSIARTESKPTRIAYRRNYYHSERGERIMRNSRLKRIFGITVEDYDSKMVEQGGLCAICLKPDNKRLAIDHCHKTKRVRGLLCQKCNRAVGLLADSSEIATRLVKYLQQYGF